MRPPRIPVRSMPMFWVYRRLLGSRLLTSRRLVFWHFIAGFFFSQNTPQITTLSASLWSDEGEPSCVSGDVDDCDRKSSVSLPRRDGLPRCQRVGSLPRQDLSRRRLLSSAWSYVPSHRRQNGDFCHVCSACIFIDQPRSRFCLSVCLSDDNFWKPWCRKFIFAHPVYLQALRVKFIRKGHQVKVKVTGDENVQNAYYRNVNFHRP